MAVFWCQNSSLQSFRLIGSFPSEILGPVESLMSSRYDQGYSFIVIRFSALLLLQPILAGHPAFFSNDSSCGLLGPSRARDLLSRVLDPHTPVVLSTDVSRYERLFSQHSQESKLRTHRIAGFLPDLYWM